MLTPRSAPEGLGTRPMDIGDPGFTLPDDFPRKRILIVPLYPQYAAATSATVCDEAFRALMKMRWQPAVRIAPPWPDDPVYIESVASSLEAELARLPFKPDVVLVSFHGIPDVKLDLRHGDRSEIVSHSDRGNVHARYREYRSSPRSDG